MKFTISCLLILQMLHTKFGYVLERKMKMITQDRIVHTHNDGRQPIAIHYPSHSGDLKRIFKADITCHKLFQVIVQQIYDILKTNTCIYHLTWNYITQHLKISKMEQTNVPVKAILLTNTNWKHLVILLRIVQNINIILKQLVHVPYMYTLYIHP